MERPVFKPLGSSVYDLDTPSLFVIRDRVLANAETYRNLVSKAGKRLTPNASTHRTPALSRLLNQNDIYVNTISEAIAFSNVVSGQLTIGRPFNSTQLQSILAISSVTPIRIVASSEQQISEMAALIQGKAENISFVLRVSITPEQRGTPIGQINETEKLISGLWVSDIGIADPKQQLTRICMELSQHNIPLVIETCMFPDTYSLNLDADEIVDGSHPFIGASDYCVGVISSVVSAPEPGKAFLDCGQKAISTDGGVPTVVGNSSFTLEKMSAEHGFLLWESNESSVSLGESIILKPASISDTFNLYDYLNIVESEVLVGLMEIQCRGAYS